MIFMTHAQGFHGLTDELLAELDARDVWLIGISPSPRL